MWSTILTNRCIMFHCDNLSIVHIINTQTAKEPAVMFLLRKLVVTCMLHDIVFRACHIPGHHNVLADHLSRSQFQRARDIAPWLDQEQSPMPPEIQPEHIPIKKSWQQH